MADPTLIADLIRAGVDPELIGRVSNAIVDAGRWNSTGIPVDTAAQKRRAWDRDRKAVKRNSTGIPPEIPPDTKTLLLTKTEDKKKKERGRGERIPPDWKPAQADIEFANTKGVRGERLSSEAEKFRNYWTAKAGQAASKLDWAAVWRNWILSSIERGGAGPPVTTGPPAQPVWATPPPGAKTFEQIKREHEEKQNGKGAAHARPDAGLGEAGPDQSLELPLSSGSPLRVAQR